MGNFDEHLWGISVSAVISYQTLFLDGERLTVLLQAVLLRELGFSKKRATQAISGPSRFRRLSGMKG